MESNEWITVKPWENIECWIYVWACLPVGESVAIGVVMAADVGLPASSEVVDVMATAAAEAELTN